MGWTSSPYFSSRKHCFDHALKYGNVLRRWDGKQCFALCQDREGRPFGLVVLAERTDNIWAYKDMTCSMEPYCHDRRLAVALRDALSAHGFAPTEGESRWIEASLAQPRPDVFNVGDRVRIKPGSSVSGEGIVVGKRSGRCNAIVLVDGVRYTASTSRLEKIL